MPLTDAKTRNAKPGPKPQKLFDEKGLFLFVTPAGGKLWRFKYRIGGREKLLAFDPYPELSLTEARDKRDEARKLVARGVDPAEVKKAEKAREQGADTFKAVAEEWIGKNRQTWAPRHTESIESRLALHVYPQLGGMPIHEITPPVLLAVLRRIEAQGLIESAHRARQVVGQICRYAVATGRAERDPSADLKGALAPVKVKSFASITDTKEIGGLLRAIDGYSGQFTTMCALRLSPLVFVRPSELRQAEWSEFDLEVAEWRIPAARMKMRQTHLVPLSRQAVAILRELHRVTGSGRLLFPGLRTPERPISENTVNAALRRLEYSKDEMTGHGFRSMASTVLHEQGWPTHAIERQLAHAERNRVKAAYNYAEHLPERRKMMQAWADLLDGLKAGGKIIPFRAEANG
jgi:integrase